MVSTKFMSAGEAFHEIRNLPVCDKVRLIFEDELIGDLNGTGRLAPSGYYGLVSSKDPSKVLSVVGERWIPVHHKDVFLPVLARVSTMFPDASISFQMDATGGHATMNLLLGSLEANEDKFSFGLRVSNRYKVGTTVQMSAIFIRSICQNGMMWGNSVQEVKLNHIDPTGWENRILNGYSIILPAIEPIKGQLGIQMARAMEDRIPEPEFATNALIPHYISDKGYRGYVRANGAIPDISTRWDLYNVLTEFATHRTRSPAHFESVQKKAFHVLETPFDILEAEWREVQGEPTASVAVA